MAALFGWDVEMLVKLRGLASGSYIAVDGTKKKHFYAWRGGPRLNHQDGTPITSRHDPALLVAFTKAHEATRQKPTGVLRELIESFKDSSEYKSRAAKTRKDYDRYLRMIEEKHGDMPIDLVEHRKARGVFKDWRDDVAERSGDRTADYLWTVLARVLSVAKDRGKISVNVCERGGRLYESNRKDKIWSFEAEAQFYEDANARLTLPVLIALWTGQRQANILQLTWNQYDGRYIRLEVNKSRKGDKVGTGVRLTIPVGGPLKARLDIEKAKKKSLFIVVNRSNEPYTEDGFRSSFGKAQDRAGIEELTFHDLRGSAVTRLANAGSTVPEIATITGHSLKTVQEILDKHYLNRNVELAESAIRKLEALQATLSTEATKELEVA